MQNMWLIILVAACQVPGRHFTTGDGGGDDGVTTDGSTPRLIAPLSMSTVTQQRPTL